MEIKNEFRIPAPRDKVWRALNDPEVLAQSIPGCQEIDKISETEFTAKVVLRVGPVKAPFKGKVTLSDIDPPNSYKITGEGQSGVAGFARGEATVRLSDEGGATALAYEVHAVVGGKLAQIGQRLLDATAQKLATKFFDAFSQLVAAPAEEAPAAAPAAPAPAGARPWVWAAAAGVVVAVLYLIFSI